MSKYLNKQVDKRATTESTPQQIAKIVQLLDEGTNIMDKATLAHLAASRKQAVAVLQTRTQVATIQSVLAGWRYRFASLHYRDYRFWAPVLILVAILTGVFGSSFMRNNAPIDTDSLLLASELPPEAFANKEFVAWLEHTSRL